MHKHSFSTRLVTLEAEAAILIEEFANEFKSEFKHEQLYSDGSGEDLIRDSSGQVLLFRIRDSLYGTCKDGMVLVNGMDSGHVCRLADRCHSESIVRKTIQSYER